MFVVFVINFKIFRIMKETPVSNCERQFLLEVSSGQNTTYYLAFEYGCSNILGVPSEIILFTHVLKICEVKVCISLAETAPFCFQ